MLDSFQNRGKRKSIADFIGFSAKYVVTSIATYFVLFSGSWLPMYYILGGVVNAIFGKLLKSIFKQPRPPESPKKGYGLPSSHAQSIFYFSTVLTALLFTKSSSLLLASFFSGAIWIYAYFACSWRIRTKLHTVFQTLVGLFIGCSFALSMFLSEASAYPIVGRLLEASENPLASVFRTLIALAGIAVIFSKEIKSLSRKTSKS